MMVLVEVASAGGEAEAAMLVAQLRDAGIAATARPAGSRPFPHFGSAATLAVCVESAHEARAREVLQAPPIGDDELARLAERSGPPPPD